MSRIETRLKTMGFTLPEPRQFPSPNRCGCVRVGTMLYVSGHGPHHPGMNVRHRGKLGADMTVEEGYLCAQAAVLAILSSVKQEIVSLDNIRRVVRLYGMVNSTPDFEDHPKVIDGASDLLFDLFGPAGRHARSAVGLAGLPRGQPVEINAELELLA